VSERIDILVIGGGVVGVCCAHSLASRGLSPVVVERDGICPLNGGTYGNAGLVVPSDPVPLAAPGVLGRGMKWLLDPASPFWIAPRPSPALAEWLWRFRAACRERPMRAAMRPLRALGLSSSRLFAKLAASDGSDLTYRRNGLLAVYENEEVLEEALAAQREAEALGVPWEHLDAAALRARVPWLAARLAGGVLTPEDGHVTPHSFVRGLAERAERLGAEFRQETEVLALEASGRSVDRVVTTRGVLRPRHVVLAAGAWSPLLAAGLGVRLPVQPAKGYSVSVARPAGFPELPLYLGERDVCVTPMGDSLRVAGTLELAGYDTGVRRRRVNGIVEAAAAVLGPTMREEPQLLWRGLRPLSADGLPIIGSSPRHDNLVVATGHCMIGLSLGPGTGDLVGRLVAGEPVDPLMHAFRPR
jgi:D-amino-acid dehydrogenase